MFTLASSYWRTKWIFKPRCGTNKRAPPLRICPPSCSVKADMLNVGMCGPFSSFHRKPTAVVSSLFSPLFIRTTPNGKIPRTEGKSRPLMRSACFTASGCNAGKSVTAVCFYFRRYFNCHFHCVVRSNCIDGSRFVISIFLQNRRVTEPVLLQAFNLRATGLFEKQVKIRSGYQIT